MTVEGLREVTRVIEGTGGKAETLDSWAEQVQSLVRTTVEQGGPAALRFKSWLNGVWLGHPLHPALTDVPIGAWSAGAILDLAGATRPADAAVTIGVLTAVPAALAGAADWADTEGDSRRIGFLHALLNSMALGCFIASLFARRNEQRALGIGLSTTGLTLAGFSAWLGGDLVFKLGTGVSRNAFLPTVDEFQVAASADSVVEGTLTSGEITVDGTRVPLALLRRGQRVLAVSDVCAHWGAPLHEGKLVEDDCVECPWHASQFSMVDGSVRQGPATAPIPVFEARIRDGNVEVRTARRS